MIPRPRRSYAYHFADSFVCLFFPLCYLGIYTVRFPNIYGMVQYVFSFYLLTGSLFSLLSWRAYTFVMCKFYIRYVQIYIRFCGEFLALEVCVLEAGCKSSHLHVEETLCLRVSVSYAKGRAGRYTRKLPAKYTQSHSFGLNADRLL